MMRRVVITGMGMVSPLGASVQSTWDQLVDGQSGIRKVERFDVSDLPAKIAGQVPLISEASPGADSFDVDSYIPVKEQRKMDQFIVYGIAAAQQAVEDSGWQPSNDTERERTGVIIGAGIGGLPAIYKTSLDLSEKGPRRVSPFFIPSSLINLAAGHVAIRHNFKGPNHAVVTACSSGSHAIGDASRFIQFGDADVMVAGGAEATVCRIGMAGFISARALSTGFNDTPEKASRPWDRDRDGFVMGEGAGILILEELEHAKKRGARIYAEIIGYGLSGDAHHITAPSDDGDGAYRAMKMALHNARVDASEVGYINAHGTSTPLGDAIELKAVTRLFGQHQKTVSVSSTKSAIGHLLGAAGGVEAIFTVKALQQGLLPPTLNLDNPDVGCDIDLVPHVAKEKAIQVAVSNSFGFGGTNASLVMRAYAD